MKPNSTVYYLTRDTLYIETVNDLMTIYIKWNKNECCKQKSFVHGRSKIYPSVSCNVGSSFNFKVYLYTSIRAILIVHSKYKQFFSFASQTDVLN